MSLEGLGWFQAGAVQGLELTAASERTCPFSRKNALQVSSKNSARRDFPVWHSFSSYDQGQPGPNHLCPSWGPPVESHPPWDPSLWFLPPPHPAGTWQFRGRLACSAAAWILPSCLPPSRSLPRADAGERFSGEERGKRGYKGKGTLPTLTSDTCGPHRPGCLN